MPLPTAELEIEDFELKFTRESYVKRLLVHLSNFPARTVIGYLSHDDSAPEPTGDGRGELFRFDQKNSEFEEGIQVLRLLDDLTPNFESFKDEAVKEIRWKVRALDPIISEKEIDQRMELLENREDRILDEAANLWLKALDPLLVMLDYHDGGDSRYSLDCMATDFDWSSEGPRPQAVWVPDHYIRSHIGYTAMLAQMPEGTKVEYKGGAVSYTTPSGGQEGFEDFSSAIKAAADFLRIIFDEKRLLADSQKEAMVCAQNAIDEWNMWASGDVYGVCVEVFDDAGELVENEALWGFIGQDYAEEQMTENVNYMVEKLKKSKSSQNTNELQSRI